MTITICDICGKQTEPSIEQLAAYKFAISSHGRVWDICDDCREELNRCMCGRRAERSCLAGDILEVMRNEKTE
ncbi:MAG: hypothetical protein J6Y02_08940 [Pseudobutyrivibrio sp.]|nr:hypothetical protein [Pseudobutyrivibrio sp.]